MSTLLGQQAEELAASKLRSLGFKILARNWRNRFSEIDIVAEDRDGLHFIEVKYRRHTRFGSGFDYITANKRHRLRRAALAWLHEQGQNRHYQIDIVSIEGNLDNPKVDYLPNAVTD